MGWDLWDMCWGHQSILFKYRCRKCTNTGLWRGVRVRLKRELWKDYEKEVIVFLSLFNRYSPYILLPKGLLCVFQGEHIFISTWSMFPSLLSSLPACQTISPQIRGGHVVSWSSAYEGRQSRIGTLRALQFCLLWGWAPDLNLWSCDRSICDGKVHSPPSFGISFAVEFCEHLWEHFTFFVNSISIEE